MRVGTFEREPVGGVACGLVEVRAPDPSDPGLSGVSHSESSVRGSIETRNSAAGNFTTGTGDGSCLRASQDLDVMLMIGESAPERRDERTS